MWLINVNTGELKEFAEAVVPQYGILSHTWNNEELLFQDLADDFEAAKERSCYEKIRGCRMMAEKYNLDWVWVDTCCIDKRSSAELSEAINSMFAWYKNAAICFVYLQDVSAGGVLEGANDLDDEFSKSRWFTRGWTLQELIAPRVMIFVSRCWSVLGTKGYLGDGMFELTDKLCAITAVERFVLLGQTPLTDVFVAQRMSWSSNRQTTRHEDKAYCLMGLFNVHMPITYGEGLEKAFRRLQLEIISGSPDETIFAWRAERMYSGFLAKTPVDFINSGDVQKCVTTVEPFRLFEMTNLGLKITVKVYGPFGLDSASGGQDGGFVLVPIRALLLNRAGKLVDIYLALERVLQTSCGKRVLYRRAKCNEFVRPSDHIHPSMGTVQKILVLEDEHYNEVSWFSEHEKMMRK